MKTYPFSPLGLLGTLILTLPLTACQDDAESPQVKTWPITDIRVSDTGLIDDVGTLFSVAE